MDFYKNFSKEYIRDTNDLFNYYLNTELLPLTTVRNKMTISKNNFEFILRPQCDQKCEYCYIYQHGKDLYPNYASKEELLKNLDLFLDYIYLQRKNFSQQIEIFGGDLFCDDLIFDVFDLFDKYFKIIKKKFPHVFHDTNPNIVIPNNLAWVYYNDEQVEKIEKIREYFEREYFTRIMFSWSTDGPYCVDTREKKDLPEDYFDKILDFCNRNYCGVHPMVSAKNIKGWINGGYDWWCEFYRKDRHETTEFLPPMLEVRNDDWTAESLEDYRKFLEMCFKKRLEMCDNDIEKLTKHFFYDKLSEEEKKDVLPKMFNYDNITFCAFITDNSPQERTSCSMQDIIHFNCTNLSLSICHRLSYDLFTPVYFFTDENNEHIIETKANNIDTFIAVRTMKDIYQPGCVECKWKNFCIKGCLGSQFESSGDILTHCSSVCEMLTLKYDVLLRLYNNSGVIKLAKEKGYLNDDKGELLLKLSEEMGYIYD